MYFINHLNTIKRLHPKKIEILLFFEIFSIPDRRGDPRLLDLSEDELDRDEQQEVFEDVDLRPYERVLRGNYENLAGMAKMIDKLLSHVDLEVMMADYLIGHDLILKKASKIKFEF